MLLGISAHSKFADKVLNELEDFECNVYCAVVGYVIKLNPLIGIKLLVPTQQIGVQTDQKQFMS